MKTIYLLQHKPNNSYGATKILRAYEREEDANDLVSLMAGLTSGALEVAELQLVENPIAQLADTAEDLSEAIYSLREDMIAAEVAVMTGEQRNSVWPEDQPPEDKP
jgi:hypothetical protein